MFSPVFGFHVSGNCCPSATPAARTPRNDGQLPVAALAAGKRRQRVSRPMRNAALRDGLGLAYGPPGAAIEDHPPRRAIIADEFDANAAAFDSIPIASRRIALRDRRRRDLQDALGRLPSAGEGRPSVAAQGEGAISRKARREKPIGHGRRGQRLASARRHAGQRRGKRREQ